ncbi:PrsW family glutamic-type intramembrane protease [Oscillatoria sp. FACHB-1406]|uniref:PrsW family glutamic-type intramembrane protease n=1 Tax=Oscillatoria sp. FACHB-1406 TaxID=2692846 RepID=UPI0032207199
MPLLPPYRLPETREVILGREPVCHLILDPKIYTGVSRRHLAIRPQSYGWEACDLGSANGTYLNGQRLHRCQPLQNGDRLSLGKNGPEFIFEVEDASNTSNPDYVTFTQLFPILSTGRDLMQKAFLLPAGVTVVFVVLMFASVGQPVAFNLLFAAYLAGAAYYYVYQLCGKEKPWWVLMAVGWATAGIVVSPLLIVFAQIFRVLLPGELPVPGEKIAFPALLVRMFFGAGLMEELLKALPVLFAFGLGQLLKGSSRLRERFGVMEPLDGILLGAASAVGFTLIETLGQYIPTIIQNTRLQSGEGLGQLLGLQLLIPRILGSVAGHMAYSGYFGYFIGLSALKASKRTQILLVGYLTASFLHALWNASGYYNSLLLALVGVMSYAFLAAAILKARILSPTRSQNFATRFSK